MAHISRIAVAAAACLLFGTGAVTASAADEAAATESADRQTGWVEQSGKRYFYYADGTKATGETEIDGILYLFGLSGALKTDWQTVDGKRYYYDPETGEAVFGWVDYFDSRYYVTAEDGKVTGAQEIDGKSYYFTEDGVMLSGIYQMEGTIYYSDPDTGDLVPVETAPAQEETEAIVTTTRPVTTTAPAATETETAPATTTAAAVTTTAVMTTTAPAAETTTTEAQTEAETTETTTTEIVFEIPPIITGWQEGEFGEVYYYDENGMMVTGWQEIDGNTYFFYGSGIMAQSETIRKDGMIYTFGADGTLVSAAPQPTGILDVISYKQKDSRWANVSIGSSTIGAEGCAVTSIAMLHAYTTGDSSVTPITIRNSISFTSGGAIASWADIERLGYTVQSASGSMTTTMMQFLYSKLCEGKPVVLGCTSGKWGMHFVIVTGYTGDGTTFATSDFIINDPGYSKSVLTEHLSQYPTLYKLIY